MYLPLTGFTEKEKRDYKMSVNSIGPLNPAYAPQRLKPTPTAQPEAPKVDPVGDNKGSEVQPSDAASNKTPQDSMNIDSMSTEDFVVLRAQTQNEPFAVLDEVIQRMKENVEELGEAIEAMSKLAKETAPERIALQLLKATFDAIDEMRTGPGSDQ